MNGNYLVFIKNGEVYQSGYNIVPSGVIDKVLPVKKHVANQADKLYFDGETLKVRSGETLLTETEYEEYENSNDQWNAEQTGMIEPVDELVEPE